MMSLHKLAFIALGIQIITLMALPSAAENLEQPVVQFESHAKFGELPVLPSCLTVAVYRGNPAEGPSLLLIKTTKGCVVPLHWHTAREELLMISGTGRMEMEGMPAASMTEGDYALLPGKHHHQFTCASDCLMFDAVADTFDIHYLDKSGNEIPVKQALHAVSEKPGNSQ
ncbi:MAG: hypothetical protein IH608_01565 [Proteobacteria bacterium]|nr:hypothetical protein [Pseudomonadota bacterium]